MERCIVLGERRTRLYPLLLMSESRKLLRYVNIFTYREWWQKVKGRGAVVWVWWDSGQRTFSSRRGCLWGNLFPPSHPQMSLLFLWFYLMFLFCSCLSCTGFDQGCGWWKCRFTGVLIFICGVQVALRIFLFIFFTCEVCLQVLSCLFSFSSEGNRLLCC